MRKTTERFSGLGFLPMLVWCLATLAVRPPATAQSIFASIVGTVTDATAAVVANAKVSVTNVSTNEKREFQTDQAGNYEINNLFPGTYVLEVEVVGFAKERREGIRLASNDNVRVDVALSVAKQVTGVTVSAESATRVETESSKLSDVRTLPQLRSLPLADRSVYRYLALTPGVTGGVTTMSVSGSRERQVHFAIDGVTASDIRSSTTVGPSFNFIEAFEELKIDTSNNSAEFKGLGTLNVTSRRGGNQFHAGVYHYYSSGATRARNPFSGAKDNTPNHGLGTSWSGPVYLPKLYDGRDKTFWFLSYETSFAPNSPYFFNSTVPPAVWKQGDFSRESTVIRDPFNNGVPFTDNKIPAERISVAARQFFGFWPTPNVGDPNMADGPNYNALFMAPFSKTHNAQARIDHRISNRNTIFGRYLFNRQLARYPDGIAGYLGYGGTIRKVRHILLSDTHIFTATLINEFRFGASLDSLPWKNTLLNSTAFIQAAGLTNVTRDGTVPDVPMIPLISFSQGPGLDGFYPTAYEPLGQSRTFQWQDTVSKITGKHSLRFGVEINWRHGNIQQEPDDLLGSYDFGNQYTGFNFADFLLGIPSTISRSAYVPARYDRQIAYDFFFQDNYKITNRLTLNLGLRYEFHPGWTTSGSRISAFDRNTGSIVVPDAALPLVSDLFPTSAIPVIGNSSTSFNDRLFATDKNNIAPRIGFAWRPFRSQTFVVRGGYGIFYEIIPRQQTLFGTPFVVNEPGFTNPADVTDPDFVQWPLAYPTTVRGAGVSLPTYYSSDFRTPYAQNWNVTVEKEVAQMVVRAAYVGTGARKMAFPFNINQPVPGPGLFIDKPRAFPTLANINEQRNGASHTYHALNLEVERRMFNGLLFQSTLTIARDKGTDGATPENTFDLARERGMMQLLPHRRWVSFVVYELPVGKGKRFGANISGPLSYLIGGWELSATAVLRDGQNETPLWRTSDIHGIAYTTSSTAPQVNFRPDCVAEPNYSHEEQSLGAWYNVGAFSLPTTPGVFGNCERGIIHGPGVRVLHGGLYKNFKIGERLTVRLGTQATNVLNHTNYGNLSGSALRIDNTSGRGKITGVYSSGAVGDAAGPRSLRLDMRIDF
jgi:Carboxypeptidase regulatory-like domain/TonB dependent receptor